MKDEFDFLLGTHTLNIFFLLVSEESVQEHYWEEEMGNDGFNVTGKTTEQLPGRFQAQAGYFLATAPTSLSNGLFLSWQTPHLQE